MTRTRSELKEDEGDEARTGEEGGEGLESDDDEAATDEEGADDEATIDKEGGEDRERTTTRPRPTKEESRPRMTRQPRSTTMTWRIPRRGRGPMKRTWKISRRMLAPMTTGGPKEVYHEVYDEPFRDLLLKADSDKNGRASIEELMAFHTTMQDKIAEHAAKKYLQRWDEDLDGKLSKEEVLEAAVKSRKDYVDDPEDEYEMKIAVEKMTFVTMEFGVADEDGDAFLDTKEIQSLLYPGCSEAMCKAFAKGHMEDKDMNNDIRLTKEEVHFDRTAPPLTGEELQKKTDHEAWKKLPDTLTVTGAGVEGANSDYYIHQGPDYAKSINYPDLHFRSPDDVVYNQNAANHALDPEGYIPRFSIFRETMGEGATATPVWVLLRSEGLEVEELLYYLEDEKPAEFYPSPREEGSALKSPHMKTPATFETAALVSPINSKGVQFSLRLPSVACVTTCSSKDL